MVGTLLNIELITDELCTQGYCLIDQFLPPEEFASLRTIAQELHEHGQFRSAKIGLQIEAQQNNAIRTDKICWLDESSSNKAIQAYLSKVNQLASLLNQSLFLSLREFETHFAAFQPGAFYKKHIDQFSTAKTRKISCVYYLNDYWHESFGGILRMYKPNDDVLKDIIPQGNRFICFNSELPHEVTLTHQPRFSLTGWLKTSVVSSSALTI